MDAKQEQSLSNSFDMVDIDSIDTVENSEEKDSSLYELDYIYTLAIKIEKVKSYYNIVIKYFSKLTRDILRASEMEKAVMNSGANKNNDDNSENKDKVDPRFYTKQIEREIVQCTKHKSTHEASVMRLTSNEDLTEDQLLKRLNSHQWITYVRTQMENSELASKSFKEVVDSNDTPLTKEDIDYLNQAIIPDK